MGEEQTAPPPPQPEVRGGAFGSRFSKEIVTNELNVYLLLFKEARG